MISLGYNMSRSCLSRVIDRGITNNYSASSAKRTGRPKKLGEREKRLVIRMSLNQ